MKLTYIYDIGCNVQNGSATSYFVFSGKGGPEQKEYEMTMEFYKEVNPEVRGVWRFNNICA